MTIPIEDCVYLARKEEPYCRAFERKTNERSCQTCPIYSSFKEPDEIGDLELGVDAMRPEDIKRLEGKG